MEAVYLYLTGRALLHRSATHQNSRFKGGFLCFRVFKLMKKIIHLVSLLSLFLLAYGSPPLVLADFKEGNGCTKIGAEGQPVDAPSLACLAQVVVNVIGLALAFLGFVTLVFLLIGSIKFITSRGDQKALQSAKNTMTYAILGAVLVIFAFFAINTVTTMLGLPPILSSFTLYQP